jgi:hypothetical protein
MGIEQLARRTKNRQRNHPPRFWTFQVKNAVKSAKKKGPLASKRPKSREETPKEGGGTRRKSRTALQ